MSENAVSKSVREPLILAGIEEINKYGIQNFSVRRIAKQCGVSCAAPYKHFEDRHSFFAAIIAYINDIWHEKQNEIMKTAPSDTRHQILAISLAYVRFLVDNPHFRSIIMLKDEEFDSIYEKMRGKLSDLSLTLVNRYCSEANLPEAVAKRKLYIVRSLIYGAALMFDNGEMPYTDENMKIVEFSINREFDLP